MKELPLSRGPFGTDYIEAQICNALLRTENGVSHLKEKKICSEKRAHLPSLIKIIL